MQRSTETISQLWAVNTWWRILLNIDWRQIITVCNKLSIISKMWFLHFRLSIVDWKFTDLGKRVVIRRTTKNGYVLWNCRSKFELNRMPIHAENLSTFQLKERTIRIINKQVVEASFISKIDTDVPECVSKYYATERFLTMGTVDRWWLQSHSMASSMEYDTTTLVIR